MLIQQFSECGPGTVGGFQGPNYYQTITNSTKILSPFPLDFSYEYIVEVSIVNLEGMCNSINQYFPNDNSMMV